MPKTFRGRTADAEAPFLNADFWERGKSIVGVVTKVFETQNEHNGVLKTTPAYVLRLENPVEIGGDETDKISIGMTAGIKMALEAAGVGRLQLRDVLTITCEGSTPSKKEGHSPRTDFEIEVTRP